MLIILHSMYLSFLIVRIIISVLIDLMHFILTKYVFVVFNYSCSNAIDRAHFSKLVSILVDILIEINPRLHLRKMVMFKRIARFLAAL